MRSNYLRWYQSMIVSLCAPHHLAGVAFNAKSSASNIGFLVPRLHIVLRKFPNNLARERWVVL
jgi:hypothetical protein